MARQKYYAVRAGRDGPKIYLDWDDCKAAVSRFPNASHKSFMSRAEAESWLAQGAVQHNNPPGSSTTTTTSTPRPPPSNTSSAPPLKRQRTSENTLSTSKVDAAERSASKATKLEPTTTSPDLTSLSDEQRNVLDLVKSGKSVFFTGSAGTGKSFLLRAIIAHLEERHGTSTSDRDSYGITASTGIAAVNIGGCTLHSWSGIGLGPETAEQQAKKILYQAKCRTARDRWKGCQTLVIDEISMIDGKLLDKLEAMGRLIRGNDEPFGGIQLVLSGDFAQLPPVPDRDTKTGKQMDVAFAFEAKSWARCIERQVVLKKVFRQRNQDFVDMLNAMRFGQLDPSAVTAFSKLSRPITYTDGLEPTELYARRNEVSTANAKRLNALQGKIFGFRANDIPGKTEDGKRTTDQQTERLCERTIVGKELNLKIGAQVMLVKNQSRGLVNGSLGVVVDVWTPEKARDEHVDISDEDPEKNEPTKYRGDSTVHYPLVKFANGKTMLCAPADFDVMNAAGEMEARRVQVPLILAWALSIHKSQGQTLERVKVNLGSIFEKGQAYVALSRATTMEGLQVLGFTPGKVMAHPKVVRWYGKLMELPFRVSDEADSEREFFGQDEEEMFDDMHRNW